MDVQEKGAASLVITETKVVQSFLGPNAEAVSGQALHTRMGYVPSLAYNCPWLEPSIRGM